MSGSVREFNNVIDGGVRPAVCSFQVAFRTMLKSGAIDDLAVCQWAEEALMEKNK